MTFNQTTRKHLVALAITAGALVSLSAVAAEAQQVHELFSNMNTANVQTGAASRATFHLYVPSYVTEISTYHWNNGQGAQPGSITLRHYGGQTQGTYGPFHARGVAGQFNAQNVTWTAAVNLALPAGLYEVFDSSPATWSFNSFSQGRGFTKVMGHTNSQYLQVPVHFTPCTPTRGLPAVVGPCSAKPDTNIWLDMRSSLTPGFVRFVSGMGNHSGLSIQAAVFRQTITAYTIKVPAALCAAGAGPNFNVILYDGAGRLQGQIGTFTPDCR